MKQIISYFTILALAVVQAFADGWNSEQTSQTSASQYTTMDNFANKDGIHVVRIESGSPNTLKYNLLNSAGTLIRTSTIDNSVSNSPVIVSDNNYKLYAVYSKGTQIVVKQSTDVGQNWTSPSFNTRDFESGHTTSYGIDAVVDVNGKIHIAYATKGQSTDYEVYYRNYTPSTGVWDNFKNVTDYSDQYGNSGIDPAIAVSSGKVHVTLTSSNRVKSRDRIISNDSWEDPQQINPSNQNGYITSLITDNTNVYVVYTRSYGTGMIVTPLMYSKRSVNGTSWDTPTELVSPVESQYPSKIAKTADGNLYAVYRTSSNVAYRKFNGTTWESQVLISSSFGHNIAVSPVGNDLYVNWLEYNGNWILKYRQYDAAPTTPTNFAHNTSQNPNINLVWSYNPEPDIQYYEVYRNNSLVETPSGTSYTDPDYLTGGGGGFTLHYKLRAKDKSSNYSGYSGIVSVSHANPFKHGEAITAIPDKYTMEQNYPNPFNPTTTINYSLPEPSSVVITVYDRLGKEIEEVVNKEQSEGYYSVTFDAHKLASGVYFYSITAGKYVSMKKMTLLK